MPLIYDGDGEYDSPFAYYDEDVAPVIRSSMETLLNTRGLKPEQLVQHAQSIHDQLENNPNYTTPNPSLTVFQDGITLASEALVLEETMKSELAQARHDAKLAVKALKQLVRLMAAYVEQASGGNPDKVLTSGFGARSVKVAQPKATPVMEILSLTPTAVEGQLRLRVKSSQEARFHEVYTTLTPEDAASWKLRLTDHLSTMLLEGFTSGTKVYVKVRAKLTKGKGYTGFSAEVGRKVL